MRCIGPSAQRHGSPFPNYVREAMTMLEMVLMLQMARSPLQAMARRLMCTGLNLATQGRRQCRSCPGASSSDQDD